MWPWGEHQPPRKRMRSFLLLALALGALKCHAQRHVIQTYNIRYDNPDDGKDRWDLRKATLANAVLKTRPSIIGLQEALAHQLDFLDARWPGYSRFGVGRDDGMLKGEFAPIYFDTTTLILIEGRTIWLSPTPDVPSKGWDAACERIATLAVLRDRRSGDSLWVINTHWDHVGELARLESAALVLNILEPLINARKAVLLLGDLNAEPGSAPIERLTRSLADACPPSKEHEATFNGFNRDAAAYKRIDYIWFNKDRWKRRSYSIRRPLVKSGQASDHYLLVARLKLRRR